MAYHGSIYSYVEFPLGPATFLPYDFFMMINIFKTLDNFKVYLEEVVKGAEVFTTEEAASWFINQHLSSDLARLTKDEAWQHLELLECVTLRAPTWFCDHYKFEHGDDPSQTYRQLFLDEIDASAFFPAHNNNLAHRLLHLFLECWLEAKCRADMSLTCRLKALYNWDWNL